MNCAVLGDELFDSEMFGHARGAFTGASRERKGLLALSSGGTVFLDEVAELMPRAQAKLLRSLQDGQVRRLGENRTERLDLRVVAATNRPLDEAVGASRFRRDLLYRLEVVQVAAPPLRERRSDIPRLTEHYWKDVAAAAGSRARLAPETVAALRAHRWPGNVRELQNVLANLTLTAPRYGAVELAHLPAALGRPAPARPRTLAAAREDLEQSMVRDALDRHGDVTAAAGDLGLARQGPSRLMARLEIDRADPARDRPAGGRSR